MFLLSLFIAGAGILSWWNMEPGTVEEIVRRLEAGVTGMGSDWEESSSATRSGWSGPAATGAPEVEASQGGGGSGLLTVLVVVALVVSLVAVGLSLWTLCARRRERGRVSEGGRSCFR